MTSSIVGAAPSRSDDRTLPLEADPKDLASSHFSSLSDKCSTKDFNLAISNRWSPGAPSPSLDSALPGLACTGSSLLSEPLRISLPSRTFGNAAALSSVQRWVHGNQRKAVTDTDRGPRPPAPEPSIPLPPCSAPEKPRDVYPRGPEWIPVEAEPSHLGNQALAPLHLPEPLDQP